MLNTMRKVLCFFMAMMLAAFALPSMAASTTKYFYAVFPAVVFSDAAVAPAPNQITVTFNNATPPPGVSTINSISIIPPANVTITNVTPGTGSQQLDGSYRIANFPGIKTGKKLDFTLTVNVNVNASCVSESWQAFANAGNSYPQGDVFQETANKQLVSWVGCDGTLDCSSPFTQDSGTVTGERGQFNKDGGVCTVVVYDVAYNFAKRTVQFKWDTLSQPNAAFEYTIIWKPEFVNPATGLPFVTQVAWKLKLDGGPAYVDGRACLSDQLPTPYATLDAFTTDTITINTTAPSGVTYAPLPTAFPFPIAIGDGTTVERLSVKGTTSAANKYNVDRAQGGTSQAALAAGQRVMSTPLPLDATGNQMLVCIKKEISEALPPGDCVPQTPASACNGITTTVIDNGDGYVARSE